MTTSVKHDADLLDAVLQAHSGRVRAGYRWHLLDLKAPSPSATRPEDTVSLYHVLPWMFSAG